MREVKFRQAIFDNGIFQRFHFWGFIDNGFIGPAMNIGSIKEALKNSQQYTGLTDKNGKEIYEKDILKDRYGRIGEVMFAYGSYWFFPFEMVLVSDVNVLSKIIGNSFDNPELLESSKCKP